MYNPTAYALGSSRSCIRDLFEYGKERAAIIGEENVLDYSLGNPSIPAPPEVKEAMASLLDMDPVALHGYTSAAGNLAVRKIIADDINARFGADAKASEIFLGCGAAPELTAVFYALSYPGSEVLAIAPYFPEYGPFATQSGCCFRVVEPDIPDFQIRFDALEKALTPDTQALVINSPNNPSGTVYTEETLRRLAALLTEKSREYGHPIYIISDEPYRELVYDGVTTPWIPSIYPDTVVCYSYSKSLSLPGERIGYIYVSRHATDAEQLYDAISGAARGMGHVCAPAFWQQVIGKCTHLRPDLQAYDRNRKALYEGLVEMGYEVAKPQGAFYLFVKAPEGDANVFSQRAKKKDLLVVPGDDFGCPGYFRLCYCVRYEQIIKSLPVFRELIEGV